MSHLRTSWVRHLHSGPWGRPDRLAGHRAGTGQDVQGRAEPLPPGRSAMRQRIPDNQRSNAGVAKWLRFGNYPPYSGALRV